MEKASRVIKKMRVFASKNLDRAAEAALVCHQAKKVLDEIFDKDFCKNVEVVSFKEGVLYIKTNSPTYAQEIKMRESEIVSAVNKTLGKKLVGKIRFRG